MSALPMAFSLGGLQGAGLGVWSPFFRCVHMLLISLAVILSNLGLAHYYIHINEAPERQEAAEKTTLFFTTLRPGGRSFFGRFYRDV